MPPSTFPPNLKHRLYTLIFPLNVDAGTVLMGVKKRGFAEGKHNGFGGKVEPGESVVEAAIRELEEEACIRPKRQEDLKYEGVLLFHTLPSETSSGELKKDGELQVVYVFTMNGWDGTPTETEEMKPYSRAHPFPTEFYIEHMLRSSRQWLPSLLARSFPPAPVDRGAGKGFMYYLAWRDGDEAYFDEVLEDKWDLKGLDGSDVLSKSELEELRGRVVKVRA